MFKQGSAPRKLNSQSGAGAASLFLGTPNVFKLSYKTGDKEISGLNKFKICALVNMNVIYAPDGQWAAYDKGQPVSVQMSLNFQEIEPVYESDYQTDIFDKFKQDWQVLFNFRVARARHEGQFALAKIRMLGLLPQGNLIAQGMSNKLHSQDFLTKITGLKRKNSEQSIHHFFDNAHP